jgi:glutathione S-transferase
MVRREDCDWVKVCQWVEVNGKRGHGRGRKTWREWVEEDMKALGLRSEDAQERLRRRKAIWGDRLTRACME